MFHCVRGIFRVGVASAPRALVMRFGARPLLAHASSLAITVAAGLQQLCNGCEDPIHTYFP